MRLMVTGATGFLGSRTCVELRETCDVRTLPSALLRGELTPGRTEELYAAVAEAAPDVLFHTAAISDTKYAERFPEESYRANVQLPTELARIAAKTGCKLVFCSSDQVYGGCSGLGPFKEDAPLAPRNVYGRHKLEAERRVADASPSAVSLRFSWMYDLPACGLRSSRNLLTGLLSAALRREPVRLSDADYRGVTYVRQVIRTLPAAFALPGGAYNFGSGGVMSAAQIALAWCETLGLDPAAVEPFAGDLRSLCMDGSKCGGAGIVFDDSVAGLSRCLDDYGLATA